MHHAGGQTPSTEAASKCCGKELFYRATTVRHDDITVWCSNLTVKLKPKSHT